MFTSIAHAMGAAPQGGQAAAPDGIAGLLAGPLPMLILMFAIFYFLLIRPQQKKAKQHKEMLAALKVGDKVMTGGGFYGRVTEIDQDILTVEISENVKVKINRGYIAGPADAKAGDAK
jgi:preprotein translocase subunit YajC